MLPLFSRAEARAFDRHAMETLGVAGLLLMENAGLRAAESLRQRFHDRMRRVLVFGGSGQNGGDGWVVARQLLSQGHEVEAWLLGDASRVRGDAAVNLEALKKLGVDLHLLQRPDDLPAFESALQRASLSVDALFGTGLDRALSPLHQACIQTVNRSGLPCVALDMPSGICADSGKLWGSEAIRAQRTLTFAAAKRGMFQHPAADYCGEIEILSLGVPAPRPHTFALLERQDVRDDFQPRARDQHKGQAGRVWVVGGSPGHSGAAWLSGRGAQRAGAGLVTLATWESSHAALESKVVEMMTLSLGRTAAQAIEVLEGHLEGLDALVLGPGLGLDEEARKLVEHLYTQAPLPLVVDADALTLLSARPLSQWPTPAAARVLTPHPGEAARLLQSRSAEVQADRFAALRRLCEGSGQTVVLKGAHSLIGHGDQTWLCPWGSPAMACAGSGDVLSGIAAAALAHLPPPRAALFAVGAHALAGEAAARSDRGLIAQEIAEALPQLWQELSREK